MKRTILVTVAGAMLLSFLALEALFGMGRKAPTPASTIPYLYVSGEDLTRPFLWSPDRPMSLDFFGLGYKKEKVDLSSIRYVTEEFTKGYIAGTMDTWAFLGDKYFREEVIRASRAWRSCQLKNDGVRSKATTGAATLDEAYQRTTEWLAAAKIEELKIPSDQVYPMEFFLSFAWFSGDPPHQPPISSSVPSKIEAIKKKEEAEKKDKG
jgi:hypothetical protein